MEPGTTRYSNRVQGMEVGWIGEALCAAFFDHKVRMVLQRAVCCPTNETVLHPHKSWGTFWDGARTGPHPPRLFRGQHHGIESPGWSLGGEKLVGVCAAEAAIGALAGPCTAGQPVGAENADILP